MTEQTSLNSGAACYCPELTLNDYLSRLKGVTKSGDEYKALCPAHDDHNPSLSIRQGDTGKPVLYCHVGCSYDEILNAMGIDRPMHLKVVHSKPAHSNKIVATYNYRNEHGDLLYQKVRYEPKDFRMRRLDGKGGWVWNKGDSSPVLYRLPDVLQAKAEGNPVFVVEGEKDSDRLRLVELTATTNIDGASEPGKRPKWNQAYTDQLSGCTRVVILPDNDHPGKAHAEHIASQLVGNVADIRLVELPGLPPKGDVSDWLNDGHTIEEFLEIVEATAPYKAKATAAQSDTAGYSLLIDNKKIVQQSVAAAILAKHINGLVYDHVAQRWMIYLNTQWKEVTDTMALRKLMEYIDKGAADVGYSISFAYGASAFLKARLAIDGFDDKAELVPFKNGVLNLSTMELMNHSPEFHILWCLPFDYDPSATCESVVSWLKDCVAGDILQVELLRAYIKAILTGRADLQRYLELIGAAGSDKGTFIRLCTDLIGPRNTHVTEFKRLENNRFEPARLYGKRLCVISDAEKYTGDVSILKSMTGEDYLPFEEKNKQGGENFKFRGMVLIAANQEIASGDMTGALQRRMITVRFENQVSPGQRRNLNNEFKPYLPGVITWALSMSDARMRQLLVETDLYVPMVRGFNLETLRRVNPMATWADECLILSADSETPVGISKKVTQTVRTDHGETETRTVIEHASEWIYPNYVEWCEGKGHKPCNHNNFTGLLFDLLYKQLKLEGIEKLDRAGSKLSRFKGIRLRTDSLEDHETGYLLGTAQVRHRYGSGTALIEESTASTAIYISISENQRDVTRQDLSVDNDKSADNSEKAVPAVPAVPAIEKSIAYENAGCTEGRTEYGGRTEGRTGLNLLHPVSSEPPTQDDGYMDSLAESLQPVTTDDQEFHAVPRPTAPLSVNARSLYKHMLETKATGWKPSRELARDMGVTTNQAQQVSTELMNHRIVHFKNDSIKLIQRASVTSVTSGTSAGQCHAVPAGHTHQAGRTGHTPIGVSRCPGDVPVTPVADVRLASGTSVTDDPVLSGMVGTPDQSNVDNDWIDEGNWTSLMNSDQPPAADDVEVW